ncbi:hypothetical protein NX786_23170 [Telluria mixta]|uniref:Transcriptional regulator n=1 Tax=Telluria mixta TaxID=34071 RepID=A0ABT2C4D4_9BURK|nr:hypothetical protein [Telluria mixta]MCS0632235.1 hypothetical protein [Telluria mixta]WEM95006.1 hypothetical protein P0M04_26485 [Telluria mixta]
MTDSNISFHQSRRASTLRQPGLAQYQAAVLEFDRLWESGGSRRQPERMKRLLALIEQFEEAETLDRAGAGLP